MLSDVATLNELNIVFENILTAVLSLAGIVLFLMFLVGGFKYLTAGGDPKKTESAKATLTQAIIGIVLIAAAYLLLVIIEAVTGAKVTEFNF